MESIKSIRNREAAKGGLVLGLVLVVMMLVNYIFDGSATIKNTASLLSVGVISIVLHYFTRGYANLRGDIGTSYSTVFGFIVLMSVYAGLIYGTLSFVQKNYVDYAYYEQMLKSDIVNNPAFANEQKDALIQLTSIYLKNPIVIILTSLFESLLTISFFGLIVATFVKREKVDNRDNSINNSNDQNRE